MNLEEILQMQKDRSDGVMLCRSSIDRLIGHALMREIEHQRVVEKAADAIPTGWQLVPISPNEEMLRPEGFTYRLTYDQYKAMLAAAKPSSTKE